MTYKEAYELRTIENKQLRKQIDKLIEENKALKRKLEQNWIIKKIIMNINKFLSMYIKLSEEQKKEIFTEEQRKIIDTEIFFEKLYSDSSFRQEVQDAIANQLYSDFIAWED